MEYQKIVNLLDTTSDKVPKFITKKWKEVCDQSGTGENRYKPSKQITFKTSMLRSDYRDVYIVVKRTIAVSDSLLYGYNFTIFKILIFAFGYYFYCIPGTHNSHGAR